jgi:lysozyme
MTEEYTAKSAPTASAPDAALSTPPIGHATTNTNPNSNVSLQTKRIGKPWKISDEGIKFVAVCESGVLHGTYMGLPVVDGMILKVYNDSRGNPTVGLGHLVIPEDHLKVGDDITVERARDFAKRNFTESESAINRRINVPLHQYEYDALVSISFNAGPAGGIAHLVDKVNAGDFAAIPAYIRTYRAHGIEWRRALEARLFETGNYDATHEATHKAPHKSQHNGGHRGHH